MFKSLLRDRLLLLLAGSALALQLLAFSPGWIERNYTYGIYPVISRVLRALLGWIPFSMGDILYFAAGLYLAAKVFKFFRLIYLRRLRSWLSGRLFRKFLRVLLAVYLVFNLLWGMNYDRRGIAGQLGLEERPYGYGELIQLADQLQLQLCYYGDRVDSIRRLQLEEVLIERGIEAYGLAEKDYPYLHYRYPSIKASLYTPLGHYFGFTGYYNPFTAEAQLKTSIPVFLKPFVVTHEIAHQLGYAKENEANFVGFLAARASADPEFVYSAYFEMYLYTLRELSRYNPWLARAYMMSAHQQVRADRLAYRQYLRRSANRVEPVMTIFYDSYLRLNKQPSGTRSYNEVVVWLVAYGRKWGWRRV